MTTTVRDIRSGISLLPEVPLISPIPAPDKPAPSDVCREEKTSRYSVRIRELPADERPRERLIGYGADALSTAELLAILLRTGTEQRSAVALADFLLARHGGLRGVAAMTVEELSQVHGIGPAKGAQIKAAIEFGRRLVSASPEERTKIHSPRDVYNLIGPALRDEKREHFVALLTAETQVTLSPSN